MSNQNNTRKARVTSNDIVMAYMLEGIESVSRSLVDHTNPTKCLDDAMDKMLQRNASVDVSELQHLREKFANKSTNGRRGSAPLVVGSKKTYSTQRVGEEGDLFIRLPVSLLVSQKGDSVEVTANDDGTLTVRAFQA